MSKTKIEDYEAVIATMNKYIDGCGSGDTALLKEAFHEKCLMTGFINGDLYMDSINGFYDMVEKMGPPNSEYKAKADVIALEGTVAVAHVAFESWHGMSFTDYHQLLKENGTWKIISKSYHQL